LFKITPLDHQLLAVTVYNVEKLNGIGIATVLSLNTRVIKTEIVTFQTAELNGTKDHNKI
jgi:hypothetical protein